MPKIETSTHDLIIEGRSHRNDATNRWPIRRVEMDVASMDGFEVVSMTPDEARAAARQLIAEADVIDPPVAALAIAAE